jgi:hypothetical protein
MCAPTAEGPTNVDDRVNPGSQDCKTIAYRSFRLFNQERKDQLNGPWTGDGDNARGDNARGDNANLDDPS